jgi:ribonuclease PH
VKRASGRAAHELRPIKVSYNILEYAAGSVLFQIGKTKVICAVTLQPTVPPFLKNKKTGWLNAEYAMLPAATHVRKEREVIGCKRNGRSIEIGRLIGRSLRAVVDLDLLGERTIQIDCDVLQADGGTRTAAITGSYLALHYAVNSWLERKIIERTILKDQLVAVSLGVHNEHVILDLDFQEDSMVDADFNFVLTRSGAIVEVQGTSEHKPVSWEAVLEMHRVAVAGAEQLFALVEPRENSAPPGSKPFNQIKFREAS